MTVEQLEALDLFQTYWAQWRVVKAIGQGSYGCVFHIVREQATVKSSANAAALKWIRIPKDPQETRRRLSHGASLQTVRAEYQAIRDRYQREIDILDRLRGESNILSYQSAQVSERSGDLGWDILIEMELLRSLTSAFGRRAVSEADAIRIGTEISEALDTCHRFGIIHRDVKLDNIFITGNASCKLGDFGRAIGMEEAQAAQASGNEEYMAPEVYKTGKYSALSDQYALGLVLYRLMNEKREPFIDLVKSSVTEDARRQARRRRLAGEALEKPARCSEGFWQVIRRACAFDPAARYGSMREMKAALLSNRGREAPAPDGAEALVAPPVLQPQTQLAQREGTELSVPAGKWLARLKAFRYRYIAAAPVCALLGAAFLFAGMQAEAHNMLRLSRLGNFDAVVALPPGVRQGTVALQADGNIRPQRVAGEAEVYLAGLAPGTTYSVTLADTQSAARSASFTTGYPDAWEEPYARITGASLLGYEKSWLRDYDLPYIIEHRDLLASTLEGGVFPLRALPTWSMQERYLLLLTLERTEPAPAETLEYSMTIRFAQGGTYAASDQWTWPASGLNLLFAADLTPLLDAVWADRGAWPEDAAELSLYFDGRLARTLDVRFAPPGDAR